NLETMPKHIQKIAVTVTIYEAAERRQNFGQVSNSYIRVLNSERFTSIFLFVLKIDFFFFSLLSR
ncbi:TerD family protein, partial [Clostridioides difficile]